MLPGGDRTRALFVALMGIACVLAARPVLAQLDLTGPWDTDINIPFGPSFDCTLDFVQTGATFTSGGECGAIGVIDVDGTVDLMTGALSGAGTAGPACPTLTLTGGSAALDNATFIAHFQCSGGPLTVPGTILGYRCGNGMIDPVAGENCEDGNRFTGDCCSAGCMAEPAGQNCGFDANQCTSDVCDGAGLCIHPNRTGPCDDGNQCTGGDECIDGSCVSDPLPDGSGCVVGDECTTDACQAGVCVATPLPDGSPCDDGLFCTDGSGCLAGLCPEGPPTDCPPCMWCQSDACVVEGFRSGCALWGHQSSALLLRNGVARDVSKWKSAVSTDIQLQDFGDPPGTGFDVCVLDEQHQPEGHPTLLAGAEAPPGSGWKTTVDGYLFKSADRSVKLRLKAGEGGKGKVQFTAKGPSPAVAYLPPVSNYVTVYVRTPHGAEPDICFHDFFEAPAVSTEKKYKAQKPLP